MSVNENIYGAKETWLKVGISTTVADKDTLKVVNYDNGSKISSSQLWTANKAEKILVNTPVDNTIAYIGVDSNSNLAKQFWYNIQDGINSKYHFTEKNVYPIALAISDNLASPAYSNEFIALRKNTDTNAWAYNQLESNGDVYLSFISEIPSTITYLIVVGCSPAIDGGRFYFDLYTYIKGDLYNNYPIITAVLLFPCMRTKTGSIKRELTYIKNFSAVTLNDIINESYENTLYYRYLRYTQPTINRYIPSIVQYYNPGTTTFKKLSTTNTSCLIIHGASLSKTTARSDTFLGIVGDKINVSFDENKIYQYSNISDFETPEKFYEYCLSQTAYLGMYFTDSYYYLINDEYDSDNIYLGTIDDNGITHGEYTRGINNRKQKQWSWITLNENEFKPDAIIENDKGDLTSNRNLYTFGHGAKFYQMNVEQFSDLIEFLNTGYKPTQEQFVQDFKGKNPIEYITTVLQYPLPMSPQAIEQSVYIGGVLVTKTPYPSTTPLTALRLPGSASTFYSFGSIPITPTYNDFRDYEPFTTAVVQLPFIGDYTLDLKKFMNHTLTLEYIVDYMSGSCTAQIYLDSLVIDTVEGQIGYTIPLSGIAQGDFQNTLQRMQASKRQATYGLVGSVIGTIANPASALNIVSSADNLVSADYTLEHTAPTPTNISTASALNAFGMDRRARLIFYRASTPGTFNPDIYAHTVGNMCISSGKVGDFSGYLECSNADLSDIPCTDNERIELLNMLKSGIYV